MSWQGVRFAFELGILAEDATAVARLRAAGVVIIGKSMVPVFSGDFQSYNPAHGTTNNPRNPASWPTSPLFETSGPQSQRLEAHGHQRSSERHCLIQCATASIAGRPRTS